MKKWLGTILLAVILVVMTVMGARGEVFDLETRIDILGESNNSFVLVHEDGNDTFTCSESLDDYIKIRFERDLSTTVEEELKDIKDLCKANADSYNRSLQDCFSKIDTSKDYYDKYLVCVGDVKTCENEVKILQNNGEQLVVCEGELDGCDNKLNVCEADSLAKDNALRNGENDLESCEENVEKCKSEKLWNFFYGMGLVGLIWFFRENNRFFKGGRDRSEKDFNTTTFGGGA